MTKKRESVDSYLQKIELLISSGNTEGVLECFEEASKLHPDNIEIYMEKADFYFDIGEKEKALECYDMVYEKIR